jgi:hypothetical protein
MQLHLCFCWQHCRFHVHRYAWFSSRYICADLNLLGQLLCHNRNANNGRSNLRCTKKEQSSVIHFLWTENESVAEIHRSFLAHCGSGFCRKRVPMNGWKITNCLTCYLWRNQYMRDLLLSENIFLRSENLSAKMVELHWKQGDDAEKQFF